MFKIDFFFFFFQHSERSLDRYGGPVGLESTLYSRSSGLRPKLHFSIVTSPLLGLYTASVILSVVWRGEQRPLRATRENSKPAVLT